ncbi:MAG: hypothetical protein V4649_16675 [Bacteroidota bacterium]
MIFKKVFYAGIGGYVMMLVLSLLFYRERIIMLDTSFALFHIARKGSFSLYASRCGAMLSQLLPVAGVKAGASLSAMAMLYSLGFTLYYFAAYLLCGLFKRYDLALVLLLFHTLIVTDTFYYIPSEFPQGLNFFMPVLAGFLATPAQANARRRLLCLPAFFVCAFFHPLMFVAVIFTTVFLSLRSPGVLPGKQVILLLAGYLSGVVINHLFFRIPYDRHAISGVKNFVTLFPNYFDLYSHRQFLHDCIYKYYWAAGGFVAVSTLYVLKKEWTKLMLIGGAFIGYIFLVNVSYPTAETPALYMENLYLPLGLILAFPIVYDLLPAIEGRRLALPLVLLVVATAGLRYYLRADKYTARLALLRTVLVAHSDRKQIIKPMGNEADVLQMLWGTPYEFWLLSTIETGRTASIIIDEKPYLRGWAADKTKALVVNWNIFDYNDLPAKYFIFRDTVTGYSVEK